MIDQDIWKNVGVAVSEVMHAKKHVDWDFLKGEDLGDTVKVTCRVTDFEKNNRVVVVLPAEMFR